MADAPTTQPTPTPPQDKKSAALALIAKALESGDHGSALDALDHLGEERPGIRTTEFWLSAVLAALGGYLALTGKQELGATLAAAAGFSYNLSRGLAKKKPAGS